MMFRSNKILGEVYHNIENCIAIVLIISRDAQFFWWARYALPTLQLNFFMGVTLTCNKETPR